MEELKKNNSDGLTLERIAEIAEAITLVGDNKYLDGRVSFRLGRLGDSCKSPYKYYIREKDKIMKWERDERKKKIEDCKKVNTDEANKQLLNDLNDLYIERTEKHNALLDQHPEKINLPELNLSDFIAKTEIIEEQDNKKITIKVGQTLVPTRFFTLMGDLINEDTK